MNKKYIISGVIALTMLAAAAGISTVLAADNTSVTAQFIGKFFGGRHGGEFAQLTDEEKAAMQAKTEAVKAAIAAGDYNAWVIATKAINENSSELQWVTADNFSSYVTQHQAKEAAMAEQKIKSETVKIALTAGDYNAWVTAVKAMNENSPILNKITAENFSRYAEANNLHEQANNILKELGVDGLEIDGCGYGMRGGMHRGTPPSDRTPAQ